MWIWHDTILFIVYLFGTKMYVDSNGEIESKHLSLPNTSLWNRLFVRITLNRLGLRNVPEISQILRYENEKKSNLILSHRETCLKLFIKPQHVTRWWLHKPRSHLSTCGAQHSPRDLQPSSGPSNELWYSDPGTKTLWSIWYDKGVIYDCAFLANN